jgi:hypothetical protein
MFVKMFKDVIKIYLPSMFMRYKFPRVEAGSNTSTVALWVVGGDEKGSLESDTVKHDH